MPSASTPVPELPPLPRRPLGRTAVQVPAVVVGAMAYGALAQRSDPERAALLRTAIDRGLTAIDTAPLYEFGRSERIVGAAIAPVRARVQVLSKVGLRWDAEHGDVLFEAWIDGRVVPVRKDSRPASLRAEVHASLARLGVERIDVCQIHHPDAHVPIADAIGTLLELRAQGLIGEIGVSNFDPTQLRAAVAAMGGTPLASVQLPLSLLQPHAAAAQTARALGVGVLAYSPLAHGALSGRDLGHAPGESDDRRFSPEFSPASRAAIGAAVRRSLLPVAARHDLGVAPVALAWVLAQPGVDAAIVGLSSPRQIDDAIAAAGLSLSGSECTLLQQAFAEVRCEPAPPPSWPSRMRARAGRLARRLRERITT
ncbi:MAG: aldo/keto reductase [Nannocystaceae bacterium]|nr:aldo/keto reductase [Nannocystaceae bacterium]